MTIMRGATLVFTNGKPISTGSGKTADLFSWIGSGYFIGIPVPVYLMLIVFGISFYVLYHTRFGRYVYAMVE